MNKILFKYLLSGFFKTIFKVIIIFYCFGIILNLFEEIEFFKNENTSLLLPIALTALYIPNMMIKLLPFIILISSMWFLLQIRNSKDLLTLKVFGYSNFKIFFILASTSFVFGWIVLFAVNPISSAMVKYYEQTKSGFSKDVDHLISINKNGLWIKENVNNNYRIISADETKNKILKNITIFSLNNEHFLTAKIHADTADISDQNWILKGVTIHSFDNGIETKEIHENYSIFSQYDYDKINNLLKNFDTMSFVDLILNYNDLRERGYNKSYLDQNLNSMLSMPFFLFLMTALASIFTLNTLKKSNNFAFIITGLISCVAIYYFKDLSLALGQTNRISLTLAVWMPVVAIGLFSTIGVLQINEK
jgi:LPS export ABC transporter permease LptG